MISFVPSDMHSLEECIVTELETCEESTPANLVEAMFKYIRNETPCSNFTVCFFDIIIIIKTNE